MTGLQCAHSAATHLRDGIDVLSGCSDIDLISYRLLMELVEGVLCDWACDQVDPEEAYCDDVG